jgi:hypothetical protein
VTLTCVPLTSTWTPLGMVIGILPIRDMCLPTYQT